MLVVSLAQVALTVLLVGVAILPLLGARALVVTSGSMEPSIGVGALAVVADVDPAQVVAGDVITYAGYESTRLTTHRVLAVRDLDSGLHFSTQGDANEDPDPNLAPGVGLVGRVVTSVPHAGRVLTYLLQRWVLLALVALTALPTLVTEVRALAAQFRGRRRRAAASRGLGVAALMAVLGVGVVGVGVAASDAVMTDSAQVPDNTFATRSDFGSS